MISTKNLISSISEVSKQWIFEYYLNLSEKLDGQDVKLQSVFNVKDKIPSMFIYFKDDKYKFKDFSSGNQGDSVELVKKLFNLSTRGQAISRIISDYQTYVNHNNLPIVKSIKHYDKWKVRNFEIRHWNTLDEKYWVNFKIDSKTLTHYNVFPLEFFVMTREDEEGNLKSIKFNKPYTYGYFKENGDLYKIYMPKNLDKKFIKVQNYLQGYEQLTFKTKYLIITSSLKDLMVFNKLNIQNIEAVAPDSENTIIHHQTMNKLKSKYDKIIVLFDFDIPGQLAAEKYKNRYDLNHILLPLEKDLSDSVKKFGVIKVKKLLFQSLKNELKK